MTVGVRAWVMWISVVLACVGVVGIGHAHSLTQDPHLNPHISDLHQASSGVADEGEGEAVELSDHLALEVRGGEDQARYLAHKYHLHYVRQVFTDPPVYHLHKPSNSRRQRRATADTQLLDLLAREPGVDWVEQQKALVRDKRRLIPKRTATGEDREPTGHGTVNGGRRRARGFHNGPAADVQYARSALDATLHRRTHGINTKDSGWRAREFMDYWRSEEDDLGFSRLPPPPQEQRNKQGYHRNADVSRSSFSLMGGNSSSPSTTHQRHGSIGRTYSLRYVIPSPVNHRTNKIDESAKQNNHIATHYTREKNFLPEAIVPTPATAMMFNDPFYKDQWYLDNTGQLGDAGHDLNVTWAWRQGYTGQGIIISVLDDGIQTTNHDIAANYGVPFGECPPKTVKLETMLHIL